ncbi:hypothetical protein ACIRBY_15405 [Streptomyces sp. NPDC096136]|uniref:hypothetical protein n=1 Tax=Streptomyces sp. NPDC096136 TaxID=3366076 RepID=UPI00382FF895
MLGAVAVAAVTTSMFRGGTPASAGGSEAPRGAAAWIMNACYAPLVLWGPLLAVVTFAYALRRRRTA